MTAVSTLAPQPTEKPAAVLDAIWQFVAERGLRVGDQLPSIRELAERLSVKPTAVRDALLKAESLGLVKVLPRAGAFLRAVPTRPGLDASAPPLPHREEHNVLHLLDARRLIEVELAGRAAERRSLEDLLPVRRELEAMLRLPPDAPRADYVRHDIRFHLEVARLAGNEVLFGMQRALMESLSPYLNEVPRDQQRRLQTDRSHVLIYEALVAGDADAARSAMKAHLSLAYDSLLRDLQQPPQLQSAEAEPDV